MFRDRATNAGIAEYSLMNPTAEVRNSEPGGFSGELALGQLRRGSEIQGIGRDEFGPYRTTYELYRQSSGNGICISEGMLTSVNLNFNRDTVLIAGKDWLHYLQRRIYSFDPELYVSGGWVQWPRRWPDVRGTHGPVESDNPVDVARIVRQIFLSMRWEPPPIADYPTGSPPLPYAWPGGNTPETFGTPQFVQNIEDSGETTKYAIYPGDQTTIYDHITKLSEQTDKGFEFDIIPITREFKMWSPRRSASAGTSQPWYHFRPGVIPETDNITAFDWTNDGPDASYLIGLGSGGKTGAKVGAVWTDIDNVFEFGRMDLVYDFGELQYPDMIVQMLKDQNDLHPQKKLELQIFNPEFLPLNFYTGGRPRILMGGVVWVTFDFTPYHKVDAYFRINAIKWQVDKSTNEYVDLELEMVYEP